MFEWLNCRWRCLCQKNVSCINQKYISYRYHRNPFPPEMRSKKKHLGLILPFKAWWIVFVPTEFEKNRGLRVMVEDGFMLNSVSFENGGTPFPIVLYGVDSQAEHKSQGFSHYFPSYDNRIDPSPLNHLSCQAPDPLNVRARGAGGAGGGGGGGGGGGAAQVRMHRWNVTLALLVNTCFLLKPVLPYSCSFALLAAILFAFRCV